MKRSTYFLSLALCGALTTGTAVADWTYSSPTQAGTCAPLDSTGTATDFAITSLVNAASHGISQTLKMAFIMPSDTSTRPDIILIERTGGIKYYTALTGQIDTIGRIPAADLSTRTEDGLIGVAVEAPFKNRVYLAYSYQTNATASNQSIHGSFRLARYDFNPTTKKLDMNSAKVLLDVPSARNRWHTAGAMTFDKAGNLYWAIGDNESVLGGPGNTHDLRGSIVRIKPKEDGSGYDIPAGNFGEYWANVFQGQGRNTLAATYRDTSKVKREIYVKGLRNPYVINVEPTTQELAWSQCGPDYTSSINSEENSNTRTPVFNGWPFWAGASTVASSIVSSGQYGKNGSGEPTSANWDSFIPASKTTPTNTWTGTMAGLPGPGADTLPPVAAAKYTYLKSCAMGSLIWSYDGKVKNPEKFPPQMHRVWITGDYNRSRLRAAKVDSAGNVRGAFSTGTSTGFLPAAFTNNSSGASIQGISDIKQGPDGSLYINKYACGSSSSANQQPGVCGGIARIDYKGAACADTALRPVSINQARRLVHSARVDWLDVGVNSFSVRADGPHSVRVSDITGRTVLSFKGEGHTDYKLPSTLKNGYYYLQVKAEQRGSTVAAITRY